MRCAFLFAGIAAAATATAVARAQVGPGTFIKGSEVWVRAAGTTEPRRITDDGRKKGLLVQSKSGRRLAFVRDSTDEMADIVVMNIDGSTVSEIHFRPLGSGVSGMRGVEDLRWISDQRLVASGSVNPSTEEYAVIDVGTGKQVAGNLTDGPTWVASPDGAHAAYVGMIPHFTAEDLRRPQFCLDDGCPLLGRSSGYPPEDSGTHVEFTVPPEWSADSAAVAIIAEDYATHEDRVIVRYVGGRVRDVPAPREAEGALGLAWDGDSLVLTAGGAKWRLEADSPSFSRPK